MAAAIEEVDTGPQGVEKPGLMTRLRTNTDASLTTVRIRGGQDADDMRRLAEALAPNLCCTHVYLDYNCCGSRAENCSRGLRRDCLRKSRRGFARAHRCRFLALARRCVTCWLVDGARVTGRGIHHSFE